MNTETDPHSISSRLKTLRNRAGYSMAALATAIGMKGASSYQRYEHPNNYRRKPYLPFDIARRIGKVLDGNGIPPVTLAEVVELAGIGEVAEPAPGKAKTGIRDLKVFPVSPGGEHGWFTIGKKAVEKIERPPRLTGVSNAYAIRVAGRDMEPKYETGQMIHVHPELPARINDYVVVTLADGSSTVKRLVRRYEDKIVLGQFNPATEMEITAEDIASLERITGSDEIF